MAKQKIIGSNLCPFSWVKQERGCLFKGVVWEPVECLGDKCKLWDNDDCVINNLKKFK